MNYMEEILVDLKKGQVYMQLMKSLNICVHL